MADDTLERDQEPDRRRMSVERVSWQLERLEEILREGLARIDKRLDSADARLEGLGKRTTELERRVDTAEAKDNAVRAHISQTIRYASFAVTVLGLFVAAIAGGVIG